MDKKNNKIQIDKSLIENIKEIIINSRTNIVRKVNHALIATFCPLGKKQLKTAYFLSIRPDNKIIKTNYSFSFKTAYKGIRERIFKV